MPASPAHPPAHFCVRVSVRRTARRLAGLLLILVVTVLALGGCGRSADDLARYARLHHERGDHVSAIKEWTEALEKSPDNADILLERGESYLASRQLDAAIRDFERCLSLRPEMKQAHFLLAHAWRDSREWENALKELAAVQDDDPARVLRETGLVLVDRATTRLRDVLRDGSAMAPRDLDVLYRAVTTLDLQTAEDYVAEDRHKPEVATLGARIQGAREDLERARTTLEEAARGTNEESRQSVCELAQLDLLAARPDVAMKRLGALLDEHPCDAVTVRARRLRTDAAERMGDIAGAIDEMTQAVDTAPDDLDLRFARAMLHLKLGHVDEARADARLVAGDPYRRLQTALLGGIIKLQTGDANGAVADFQFVAANGAASPLSHLWLGLALLATSSDIDAAMAAFARAVDIEPRFQMGHLARAAGALRAGWWDVAVRHARRATELEPGSAASWLVLGEALVRRGSAAGTGRQRDDDFARATEALGRALQIDPHGFAGQEALVMRNVVTGRLGDGVAALRDALRESRDPDLLVTLGQILHIDEREEDAQACLEEAVTLAPGATRPALALAAFHEARDESDRAVAVLTGALAHGDEHGALTQALAELHLRGGDQARAAAVVEAGIARHPDDAGLLLLRLRLAIAAGDLDAAYRAATAGARLQPATRAFAQAGAFAALRGDMPSAAGLLDAALGRFPDDGPLLATRALVAAALDDQAAALATARRAQERSPTDPYVTAAAALAMQRVGDMDGARGLAVAARSLSPGARHAVELHVNTAAASAEAAGVLRDLHLQTLGMGPGTPLTPVSEIETRADALVANGTDDPLLLDMLGNARLARGDAAGAAGFYESLLKREPGLALVREKLALIRVHTGEAGAALQDLGALFQSGSASPRAHALAGALHEEQGHLDDARRHFERAAELAPDNPEITARLAHVQERLGRTVVARDLWERTLSLDPGHAVANARLAELLAATQPSRAETLARRAVALAPHAAFARRALAVVLVASSRIDEAQREIVKALAAHPNDVQTVVLSGIAAFAGGHLTEAEQAFERALELDDGHAGAHLQLGMVLDVQGDLAGALAHYERAVALGASNAVAHNNLADALLRTGGDLKRAAELAQRAVELSGGAAEMLDTLGWIQHACGDDRAACASLQRAISSDPDDLSLRYHLAVAMLGSGRRLECRRELELLEALGDDFAERDEARRLLGTLR